MLPVTDFQSKHFTVAVVLKDDGTGLPKHRKSPQNTANHRKSDRNSPQITFK